MTGDVVPGTPGECRSCHAPMRWVRSAVGHNPLPIDPDPVDDGNLVLEERDGGTYATVVEPGKGTHRSHFATCPDAKTWRRR
jgi:hypothetical protein